MKRIWILILCLTLLAPLSGFAKAPEVATYPPSALGGQYGVFYTGPGREPEAVSRAHPMPVEMIGSGTSITATGGGDSASLSVGLVKSFVVQVSTGTTLLLGNLASGVAAPFWITLRNTGLKTVHYAESGQTPTDYHDGIAPGEQIAMKVSTNTPVLDMRSNSAGISTLSGNIFK